MEPPMTELEGFEPQTRARSNTWPLPRPENYVDSDIKEENGKCTPHLDSGCVGVIGPQLDGSLLGVQLPAPGAKKNSSRRNAWGNLSYADLITQAIASVPEKRLTLSQIYEWMVQNVPYFKDKGDSNSSAGWKSGISSIGANSPRPASPPSPVVESSNTTAVTAASGPRPSSPPGRCCDTGRPLFTDPLTGQTVCSCQYDLLSYQRLASAGVTPAGIPALSMYSAPYADGIPAYFPALGADQAPFYTSSAGLELKENLAAGAASWPYPSVYHPYDSFGYPFNGYGMDLNGARRKNATRETTSTLKAWLNEHKKNPYPTKGEKIMLAIITKMTLTQVSTWFANARRRLKKENKMTWEPRNRVEEEDNNNEESGRKSADNGKDPDSKDSGTGSSEDGERPNHRMELLDRPCGPGVDTGSEWSESRADSGPDSPECLFERQQQLLHPAYQHLQHQANRLHVPSSSSPSGPPKPRIWSLADMASKESDMQPSPTTTSAFYATAAGKLISPLSRGGIPPLSVPPGTYPRPPPHEFYRSLYGPAAHLAGSAASDGVSLLETYSRTFAGGLTGSGPPPQLSTVLSKVAAAAAATSGNSSFSLNGTTQSVATGASSASSSASSASEQPPQPKQVPDHLKSPIGKP